jgi:ABC-2 type transport system ATP-binding protein
MINQLADAGAAILVTTHYLEESEQCNRLGLMVAGELVAEGRPGQIKAEQKDRLFEFIIDQPQRASDLLKKELEGWRVSLFGDRLHVITSEENQAERIAEQLRAQGINVMSIREARFSMEDVFISIVAQAQRRGAAVA